MSQPPFLEVVLFCLVAQAAVVDLARRKIPNRLVLLGLGIGLALHLLAAPGWPLAWAGGALTGFFLFLPLYLMRGMAAGDVKLMAMVGSFTGPQMALEICFATFIVGGVLALLMVVYQGRMRAVLKNLHTVLAPLLLRAAGVPLQPAPLAPGVSVGGMPYGVAIALGTMLMLLWKHS
ncbi:prepilin peptidase CpaA [Oxalobacteraceae bacterium GrIS 1.11]